jgi:hypothetical protein
VTAHQVAWELANGTLQPKALVLACPVNPACVRLDHLCLDVAPDIKKPTRPSRSRKGAGSMRLIRPGTWELRVTAGRWEDGRPRTLNRTVSAKSDAEAAAQLGRLQPRHAGDAIAGSGAGITHDSRQARRSLSLRAAQ